MGNQDGLLSAVLSMGTNKKQDFDGGYFSFAFGSEIAMVLGKEYYILNCGSRLFDEVKEAVANGASKDELIDFWLKESNNYVVSEWSADFDEIVKCKG